MLIGVLLFSLVLVVGLVVATAGVSERREHRALPDASHPRVRLPLELTTGEAAVFASGPDDPGPSPTLTIPLDPVAGPASSYVLHLARVGSAWQVAELDPVEAGSTDGAGDTLTLTLVVPWRDLSRDYRWLNVVLR